MTIGQNAIGAAFTVATTNRQFSLGTVIADGEGGSYIYVQANGAIAANDAVVIDAAHQAAAASTTNTASAFGNRAGVAAATMADDEFGWVQRAGPCSLNVGSSCAANTAINSTGTAGRLDDDATTGAEVISGIVITGAEASNVAAAMLNWPTVGATL